MPHSRVVLQVVVALMLIAPSLSSAASGRIASGQIFGIQIGSPIALSPDEIDRIPGEHSGSVVRTVAEKPADVQFLQIYKTPKSHIVTGVEGVSEFKSGQRAMAFARKYIDLLPALASEFVPATTVDTTGEYPLELVSADWRLYVLVRDMEKSYGRKGYMVRIGLRPSYSSTIRRELNVQADKERQQIKSDVQTRAVERARDKGELKGLR